MRMPIAAVLALAAALGPAGCSMESSKDRYIADYQPLNDRIVKVNDRMVDTLNTPSSPGKLARELTPMSAQLTRLGRQIADLDTPEDLRQESAALSRSLTRTAGGADRTASAAREADGPALVDATRDLADDVNALIRRSERLAEAAG